ncbi:hypothetical protein PENTCL1PPCAC_25054, partial [Pristionchus entomophagus]
EQKRRFLIRRSLLPHLRMQSLFLLLLVTSTVSAIGTRYVNIRGQLTCDNSYTHERTRVELMERDWIGGDDQHAVIRPRLDGSFNISGEEHEIGAPQFYLKITHRCLLLDSKECPDIVDEFELESSSDPKTIQQFTRALVSRKQTQEYPRNCVV